ncbi:hypothetical protein P8605_33115, partial [Streptomyces sp. T-3]|nr:hypothetical protein [Streptomyces sp. T-3]
FRLTLPAQAPAPQPHYEAAGQANGQPVNGYDVFAPRPHVQTAPPTTDATAAQEARGGAEGEHIPAGASAPDATARRSTRQEPQPVPTEPAAEIDERYFGAFAQYVSERGDYPNARQFGIYLLDLYAVKGETGGPLSENTLRPYIRDFRARYQHEADAQGGDDRPDFFEREPAGVGEGSVPDHEPAPTEPPADADEQPAEAPQASVVEGEATVVDRYFVAWEGYLHAHGEEPTNEQLAAYLAQHGIVGPQGKPVTAVGLRRYPLSFRLYATYADLYEQHGAEPTAQEVAEEAARRGITGQYNRPLDAAALESKKELMPDFRRRHQVLAIQWSDTES